MKYMRKVKSLAQNLLLKKEQTTALLATDELLYTISKKAE